MWWWKELIFLCNRKYKAPFEAYEQESYTIHWAHNPVNDKKKKMRKLTSFCWLSTENSWVVKFFFSFSSPSNISPCFIFFQDVRDSISCINSSCPMKAHLVCLAKRFLQTNREDSFLIPVEGDCPTCSSTFLWRDLIKHDNQPEQTSDPNSDSPHWAEELNRYWKTKLLSSIVVHNLHSFFHCFIFLICERHGIWNVALRSLCWYWSFQISFGLGWLN